MKTIFLTEFESTSLFDIIKEESIKLSTFELDKEFSANTYFVIQDPFEILACMLKLNIETDDIIKKFYLILDKISYVFIEKGYDNVYLFNSKYDKRNFLHLFCFNQSNYNKKIAELIHHQFLAKLLVSRDNDLSKKVNSVYKLFSKSSHTNVYDNKFIDDYREILGITNSDKDKIELLVEKNSILMDEIRNLENQIQSNNKLLHKSESHNQNLEFKLSELHSKDKKLKENYKTMKTEVEFFRKYISLVHNKLYSENRKFRKRVNNLVITASKADKFDQNWYLETYNDISTSKINPTLHYILFGWVERRRPNSNFSTSKFFEELNKNELDLEAPLDPFK